MPFDKDGKWVKPEKDWEKVRGPKETHTTAISKKTHEGNKLRASTIMQPIDIQESISRLMEVETPSRPESTTPIPSSGPAPKLLQDIPGLSQSVDWDIPNNSLLKIQPRTHAEVPTTESAQGVGESGVSQPSSTRKMYDDLKWIFGADDSPVMDKVMDFIAPVMDSKAFQKVDSVVNETTGGIMESSGLKDILSYLGGSPYELQDKMHETNLENISPGTASAADFTGQVLGLLAPTVGAAATGGKAGLDIGEKVFANAPNWLKKLGIGTMAGLGTGAALATGQESLQELGLPEEQTFGEHVKDAAKTSAYFAGYGAATPVAQKIMGAAGQKIGQVLPNAANNLLSSVGQKVPLVKDVAQGVTEGALTGSMVGSGMALGTLATTGDPRKALDVITGEASDEMKENFVQSIAFGIVRVLGGKGVHVDPQQASEEVADIIMSQFPPEIRVKLETMVEQAKIQGADDAQAKAQVIDLMGSLPDGKEVIEQAAAQILQDIQTATESTPSVIQRVASWYNNLGDEGVLPSAPDKVSPIISDPAATEMTQSTSTAIADGSPIENVQSEVVIEHPITPSKTPKSPNGQTQEPTKQTTAEKEQALSEFFENDRPEENEMIQKYAETFVTNANGDVNKAVDDMKELLSGAESMFKDDPNSLRRFKSALTHLEGRLTESKTPATTSKPPENPKVQTQASSKQSVKAVKGDTVKLKGKPNDTFEVVDIDKSKVTLKSKQGTTFVSGAGSIASVVNTVANITENEPTTVKKYGRNGNAALNKELKASSIDLNSTDGRDFEHFFEKYYNAGAKGNFMPNADIHKDMARQFYEAGKKDKVANKPEESIQDGVKDDPDFIIMKTKSLQSGKEELTVRHKDFPEKTVKLIPSELNATYIAKFQDSQKVVSNKEDAILWAKDRLKESQSNKISDLETGKKLKLTMFQGKGASLEDVYGKEAIEEGRAVPVLGKGDYYAFNSNDAANYGTVTSKEVKLDNPIVIYAGQQFRNLLEKADALHLDSQDTLFYKEPEKIAEATQKLQDYLIGLGHDGAVIQVGDNKRLIETFGHDQVVVFGSNSEQTVQKPTENATVEATKPAFTKGNKVTWTDRSGKTLTGTIRSIDTRDNYAEIDTDQIATYAGGVPIGRIELVSFSMLSLVEQSKKVESTESTSKQESKEKVTIGPVLNDHHAKMKERAERAKQRIKDKYGPGGNTLSSGFPPDLMIDFSIIGYTKILDGLADFKSWSESMMKDADGLVANSERIRKWLPGIYATSKQIAESEDPDILIDEFLVDAYGVNPDVAKGEEITEVTAYHASHSDIAEFVDREIKSYNSMGTWFTDSSNRASELYGPKVTEAKISLSNPFYSQTENFDEFFYIPELATKHGVNKLPERQHDREKAINGLLKSSAYMQDFKDHYIKLGHDGVVFKDSTIDLNTDGSEGVHTVYLVFNTKNIKKVSKGETTKLYHGALQEGLTTLKEGTWFSPVREFAEMFASYRAKNKKDAKASVYETSINLNGLNLIDISDVGMDEYVTIPQLAKLFKLSTEELRAAYDDDAVLSSTKTDGPAALRYIIDQPAISSLLKSMGYDGIKAKEGLKSKTDYVPTYKIFSEISLNNEVQGGTNNATQSVRGNGTGTLEETPSEDVQGVSDVGRTNAQTSTPSETGGGSTRTNDRQPDGEKSSNRKNELPAEGSTPQRDSSTSVGDGTRDDSVAERSGSTDSGTEPGTGREGRRDRDKATSGDYVITNELDNLGGAKTKFRNNVDAIRLAHTIVNEKRKATTEEQAILAKYTGWGGVWQALDQRNVDSKDWGKEFRELKSLIDEDVITQNEYEEMASSTQNAHYTSPGIIRIMYDALNRLGYKGGGRVLEPSVGTGNFIGLMPAAMREKSQMVGVEKDTLTGKIAKLLYPKSSIQIKGFENYKVPDGYFDVAIGNVPFGDIKIVDSTYKGKLAFVTQRIHNYFFIKSLDKVRDGGIVMFITSSGTLNSRGNANIRKLISEKADFLGAVRLPSTSFKANAGTEVTTDIIILQRRGEGQVENHAGDFVPVVESKYIGENGKPMTDNKYYVDHPEMVLGKYQEDKLYQNRLGLVSDGRDLDTSLREALSKLPENVFNDRPSNIADVVESSDVLNLDSVEQLSYFIHDNKIMQRVGDRSIQIDVDGKTAERIKGMIPIRDIARKVIRLQLNGASDIELKDAQKQLNTVYDNYVKKNGYLSEDANKRAMVNDTIGYGLFMSLEKDFTKTKTGTKISYKAQKEAIFSQRTIQAHSYVNSVENSDEALVVSLFEKGSVDFRHMSKLSGKDESQLIEELKGKIYKNPEGGWETADEYLSGNVRKKLEVAREAIEKDKSYAENVTTLEAVQPEPLEASQISVRLGSTWIPTKDIESFVNEFLETNDKVTVRYQPITATWSVEEKDQYQRSSLSRSTKNTDEYGVRNPRGRDVDSLKIIENALNLRLTTITYKDENEKTWVDPERTNEAQSKQKQIQDIFTDWVFSSNEERTTRLVEKYNVEFKSTRLREYDGEMVYGSEDKPKTMPGMTFNISLRKHQKNAVWRIVQGGNTLLAHVVGSGKTFTMIAAAMEMKRLGLVNKPMVVVPNHLLDQWEKDVALLYPGAKYLKISSDDIPSVGVNRSKISILDKDGNPKRDAKGKILKADMTDKEYQHRLSINRANRAAALSKIAVGNYDLILITHSTFGKMPVSPELVQEHIREQINDVTTAIENAKSDRSDKRTVKELEKIKSNLTARIQENLAEDSKDVGIPFEELGIDQIFVDEAHMFKNLKFHTKMRNVAGLPQTNSQRAQDMFLKTQYLSKKRNGKGVVFATGTPISNTMAEMYTMQRYLQMETLREHGLGHFDAWAALFGESVVGTEMDATGKFKQKTRFARFHNVAELMDQFRSFADIQTADMLDLPTPDNVIRETIVSPMSDNQHDYLMELVDRANAIKNGQVTPEEDNFLKLTSDGRKSALDIRMVRNDIVEDYSDSKVNRAVDKVYEIYKDPNIAKSKDGKSVSRHTQLMFLDLGTPKKKKAKDTDDDKESLEMDFEEAASVQVYEDIKTKLIRKGIKPKEIAFIHDAKTDKQRLALFEDVQEGRVRVLVGSTEKMGAGMNVQDRLVALHHLDAPWRPSDVEQREGRIIRQKNANNTVYVYNYTTEGSFDALMWDTLKRKATFIAQVMNGKANVRSVEDVEDLVMGYAQVAAITSGNPLILEKFEVDQKVLELQMLKTSYERNRRKYQEEIRTLPGRIDHDKQRIKLHEQDLDVRKETKGELFELTIGKKKYDKREEAGQALLEVYKEKQNNMLYGEKEKIGSFAGFSLYIQKKDRPFFLEGPSGRSYEFEVNEESPAGTASRLENAIRSLESLIEMNRDSQQRNEKQLEDFKNLLQKPFDKADELNKVLSRQSDIIRELTATDEVKVSESLGDDSADDLAFAVTPLDTRKKKKTSKTESEQEEPDVDDPAQAIIDMSAIGHVSPKVVREVADMVAEFLGTSIREGHVRSGAEGIFKPKAGTGAVRKRSYHEWRVVGHELGHAFSYRYGGWKGMKSELEGLAAKTYPGKIQKGREAEEGFAEFFFIWTVDPLKALELVPRTTGFFEDFVGSNKELSEIFIRVRTIIDNDLIGSPYEKAMGAISSEINPDSEVYGGEYRVPWYKRGVFRVLDYTIPAKDLMNKVADKDKHVNLAHLLAISGDAKAKALTSFEDTPRDHLGRFIEGRSLLTISEEAIAIIGEKIKWKVTKLKAINEEMGALEIFSTIMLANRVKERISRGFTKLPLTEIEADNVLVQAGKDFPEALKLADEYATNLSNLILEKLERAGVVTAEAREVIEAGSQSYIPFYYDERKRPMTSGTSDQRKTNRNPVKRFSGKNAPVLNFFQATMLKLTEVEQAIEYKRTLSTLQGILSDKGMGMFGVIVPTPVKIQNINMEQVIEAVSDLLDDGVSVEDIGNDRAIKIFMAGGFDQFGKNEPIVMNIKDGKPTFMRLAPDLFKMLMAMKPVQIEGLAKGLAWTSRIIRFTALATPRYITNAVVRDFAGALIQSKAPVHSLLKEFYQSASATMGFNEDVYNSYVASGGHSGAAENILKDMVRNTFDEGIIHTSAAGWGKVKMGSKTALVRLVRTPSEALRVIEEGPRIAEYVAVWKNQASDLGYDAEAMWDIFKKEGTDALPKPLQNKMENILIESAYASREVATNFGLHGEAEWTRKYMQTVTFLHGTTQGMYRFSRQAKDNPKRVMIGVGVLGLISVAAWALMNADDDDKKHLQDMDSAARDRYWWVPIGDTGMYYAISKPFEYALPANFLERYLDQTYANDPQARGAMEEWKVALLDSFGLHPINPFLNTWMELKSNVAWHGGDIVPMSEQYIAKDMQSGPGTSLTAKMITKPINAVARLFADSTADPTVGVSPRKVDYFIKQMTGIYGKSIMDSFDFVKAKASGEEGKGIAGLEYAPLIGSIFYSQTEGSSRIVEKFYKNYELAQTLSQSSGKMIKEGSTTKPYFATEENIKLLRYLPAIRAIAGELSSIRKEYVEYQKGATPEVRRKLTMQQDYIEKLAAGLMYGVDPPSPHEDAEITDVMIQTVVDQLTAVAQKAIVNERKRAGGATDQADYLQALIDQPNSK